MKTLLSQFESQLLEKTIGVQILSQWQKRGAGIGSREASETINEFREMLGKIDRFTLEQVAEPNFNPIEYNSIIDQTLKGFMAAHEAPITLNVQTVLVLDDVTAELEVTLKIRYPNIFTSRSQTLLVAIPC